MLSIVPGSTKEKREQILHEWHIRLNTELVKKPKDLIEYVVVHELIHLIEPSHSEKFIALMTKHFPNWREARKELNELPTKLWEDDQAEANSQARR